MTSANDIEKVRRIAEELRCLCPGARLIQEEDGRVRCFRLRYLTFIEGRKAIGQGGGESGIVRDFLDDTAILIGFFEGSEVVGTVRVNYTGHELWPDRHLYNLNKFLKVYGNRVAVWSKLSVHPGYRRSGLFSKLTSAAYLVSLILDIEVGLLGCAPRLVSLYERLGCKRYGRPAIIDPYGEIAPLFLMPKRIDWLRSIGSPLARVYDRYLRISR